jgi:nucleoside-diphosphate-sugar epimerase
MSNTDQIVVFGGSGFIGSHVVDLLLQGGYSVTVVSRRSDGAAVPGLQHIHCDIADNGRVRTIIQSASVVLHLAMGGGPAWSDYQRDFVDATRNIAQASRDVGVKRLIYVSSSAALDLQHKRRLTESDGPKRKPESSGYYSRGKVLAERLLLDMHKREGLPVIIVRPCIVVGRGGMLNHSAIGAWSGESCCVTNGKGQHPLPFVLVQDVANALVAAVLAPGIEGLTFNLAGDVRPSAIQFISWVAERSLRNIRVYSPSLAHVYAVELMKWGSKVLARKDNRLPSYREVKSRAMFSDLDCSAAKRLLKWRPNTDVDFFIREAIDSHLKSVHPQDLRLNTLRYAPIY